MKKEKVIKKLGIMILSAMVMTGTAAPSMAAFAAEASTSNEAVAAVEEPSDDGGSSDDGG